MTKTIDLSLVLPCYNEADHFHESLRRIREVLDHSTYQYEIIFVEDLSQDSTAELIRQEIGKYPNCRAIFHERNYGRGRAVCDGIRHAEGTVVGFIDIDLEVDAVYMITMVSHLLSDRADVVTGKRVYKLDWSINDLLRGVLSVGYKKLVRRALGISLEDTETGYKFFHREKILPVIEKCHHNGWFWDTEVMTLSVLSGLRIEEVACLFQRRPDKKSTLRVFPDTVQYFKNLMAFRKSLEQ
jgi:glycosyltransferase involved in cell wall biosynthesis